MGPLNWLGTLYRVIQEAFVNMEVISCLLYPNLIVFYPLEHVRPDERGGGGEGQDGRRCTAAEC